jgi:hypothetical protein
MCPVCLIAAALTAGKLTGAGGLAAVAARKLHGKNSASDAPAHVTTVATKTEEDRNGQHRDID